MSFRVVGKVLRRPKESHARRLILIVLAEAAQDDGVCWVSQEAISEKSCVERSYVNVQIKAMQEEGLLEIRKAQRGRRRISVYRMMLTGLDEPDYDRLPFELDAPFTPLTTLDQSTSSDADDVGPVHLTTLDQSTKSADHTMSLVKSKGNSKTAGGVSVGEKLSVVAPKTVNKTKVKDQESALAVDVLAEWNAQAEQRLASSEWLKKIIMRIREHPELTAGDHAHLIAVTLQDPWWDGSASPSVLYGNGAIFEKAIMTAMRRTGPQKVRREGAAQLVERLEREGRMR